MAKCFSGQKGYLPQYDRLTKEKIGQCMKFEPDLLTDESRSAEKIRRLQEENRLPAGQAEQSGQESRLGEIERAHYVTSCSGKSSASLIDPP